MGCKLLLVFSLSYTLTFWKNKNAYAKVTRNCRWPETVEFTVLVKILFLFLPLQEDNYRHLSTFVQNWHLQFKKIKMLTNLFFVRMYFVFVFWNLSCTNLWWTIWGEKQLLLGLYIRACYQFRINIKNLKIE